MRPDRTLCVVKPINRAHRKFALPLNRRKSIRKPPSPKPWQIGEPSLSQESSPDYWWYAYPVSVLPQRSYKREIFAAECALVEIIEDVLDFLIPLDDNRTPSDDPQTALMLYKRLIDWKYSLPECLHVEKVMVPTAIMLQYVEPFLLAHLPNIHECVSRRCYHCPA